jgi:hypothetical protein
MNNEIIFLIVWAIVVVLILALMYRRGKRALSVFPDMGSVKILYRDQSASGYSTSSLQNKLGGANRTLDLLLTEDELWLTSKLLLASIAEKYDMLHRIALENITQVQLDGKKLIVDFKTENDSKKQVVVMTKVVDRLITALKSRHNCMVLQKNYNK